MEKMNKRGVELDLIVFFAIAALMFVLLVIYLSTVNGVVYKIESLKQRVNNDLFLMTLMRSEFNSQQLEDTILADYAIKDFTISRLAISSVLEKAFGQRVCWKLVVEDELITDTTDCVSMQQLDIGEMDGETRVPMIDGVKKSVSIRLQS